MLQRGGGHRPSRQQFFAAIVATAVAHRDGVPTGIAVYSARKISTIPNRGNAPQPVIVPRFARAVTATARLAAEGHESSTCGYRPAAHTAAFAGTVKAVAM